MRAVGSLEPCLACGGAKAYLVKPIDQSRVAVIDELHDVGFGTEFAVWKAMIGDDGRRAWFIADVEPVGLIY